MLKVEFGDGTQKLIYQISNLSTTLTEPKSLKTKATLTDLVNHIVNNLVRSEVKFVFLSNH